jgi:Kef-type K+ transport system membrane component KefB
VVTLSVLAPIFLATAGLRIDLRLLGEPWVMAAALGTLVVAAVGKLGGGYLGARWGGLGHWEGLAIGAGLNARGLVEVVVATVGLRLGLLTTAGYTVVVFLAVVTSVGAPPVLRLAMRRIAAARTAAPSATPAAVRR